MNPDVAVPSGVRSFTTGVKRMITLAFWSMSVGAPKAAVSVG